MPRMQARPQPRVWGGVFSTSAGTKWSCTAITWKVSSQAAKSCSALGVARASSGKRAGQSGEQWSEKNQPHTGTCACCAKQMGAHEHNISSTSPAWQGSAPPSSQHRGVQAGEDGEPCSSAKNRLPLPAPPAPALLLGTFHCLCLPSCGRGTHWPLSGESSPAGSASARDGQDSDSTQGGKCSCGRDQSCSPPARWAQSCTKLAQRGAGLS